jgi:hypothetical protein
MFASSRAHLRLAKTVDHHITLISSDSFEMSAAIGNSNAGRFKEINTQK